jgi:hypothetical protein
LEGDDSAGEDGRKLWQDACLAEARDKNTSGFGVGDVVIGAIKIVRIKFSVFAQVKGGKLVGGAVKNFQRSVLAYVKRGELVVVAIKICQHGVLVYVKGGEVVAVAIKICQHGVLVYVKEGELIGVAA